MTLNFSDARDYRMGAAIHGLILAFDGWLDWGGDGKARFLCRAPDGRIGTYFPSCVIELMRDQRESIRRYIAMLREERNMTS